MSAESLGKKWMEKKEHGWSDTDHPSGCHSYTRFLIDELKIEPSERAKLPEVLKNKGFFKCNDEALTAKKMKLYCHFMKIDPAELERNDALTVKGFWFAPFSARNGRFFECLVFSDSTGEYFLLGLNVYTYLGGGLIKDEIDCNYHVDVANLVLDPPPPPSVSGKKVGMYDWMRYAGFD